MSTREKVISDLAAKIPREAIESRDGGGSRKLSYLAGWYVINRMNEIFGPDGWSYDVTELRCVHSGKIPGKYGDVESASYSATVALFAMFPGSDSAKRITDVGFGNGTDKTDPGKPHELATKEAVTDALKRCAKSLGMSLGLALYDKSQENVEEAPKAVAQAPKPAPTATVAPTPKRVDITPSEGAPRADLNKGITAIGKVCIAQGHYTKESFQAMRKQKYGVDTTEALTDAQATELQKTLKELSENGK